MLAGRSIGFSYFYSENYSFSNSVSCHPVSHETLGTNSVTVGITHVKHVNVSVIKNQQFLLYRSVGCNFSDFKYSK